MVEVATEIEVFVALMPSARLGPMLVPETTSPKLEEAKLEVGPPSIRMPVLAYRTAALTRVASVPPVRLMPPQSPAAAAGQPGTRADGQPTPAVVSARLVKTFLLLLATSSARRCPLFRLMVPLRILTMSPALTVSVPVMLRSPSRM